MRLFMVNCAIGMVRHQQGKIMTTNSKKLATAVTATFLAVFSCTVFAQNVQEEVNKQIAKLIGDAISSRVSARALDAAAGRPGAAGAEKNALWGSYTRINADFSGGAGGAGISSDTSTNAYVAGYDRELTNNLIFGASVNYADTSGSSLTTTPAVPAIPPFFAGIPATTTVTNNDSHSKGISPYLTYLFTPNVFGILRLNYTDFSGGESYGAAISINGVHRAGDFVARGRLELGSTHSKAAGTTSNATNYSGDAEAGYFFTPAVYGHVGLQLSDSNQSNSYAAYARVGIEAQINKSSAVSLKYERKVDDNATFGNFKVDSVTLAFRLRF